MGKASESSWIAVDWGTSNLRCWRMSSSNDILDRRASDKGMSRLEKHEFEPTLMNLVRDWLDMPTTPILACGMVGARQGWHEVPYAAVPSTLKRLKPVPVPTKAANIELFIVPGLCQHQPANVMRGEETQISGFLAENKHFSGLICLPGTHAKWVHVQEGTIVEFSTFMTGELFEILSQKSVLRHSIDDGPMDDQAFERAFANAFETPGTLTARLFSARAEGLLHDSSAQMAKGALSGWLLGDEFANMRDIFGGNQTFIIGSKLLAKLYKKSFDLAGARADIISGDELVVAGLSAIYQELSVS